MPLDLGFAVVPAQRHSVCSRPDEERGVIGRQDHVSSHLRYVRRDERDSPKGEMAPPRFDGGELPDLSSPTTNRSQPVNTSRSVSKDPPGGTTHVGIHAPSRERADNDCTTPLLTEVAPLPQLIRCGWRTSVCVRHSHACAHARCACQCPMRHPRPSKRSSITPFGMTA